MQSSFFFFFLIYSCLLFAQDFQLWNEISCIKPLSEAWFAQVNLSVRFRDHASKAFLYYAELDLTRKFSCDWALSLGYRHVYKLDSVNQWVNDPIPLAMCYKKWKWECLVVSHRSRIEYRMRENAPWLYRCRLDCEWQCEHFLEGCFFDCLKWWHPYVQEETYFQERYGFNENRLEVGLRRRLKKDKGFISLGYLLKEVREKTGLWEPTDVLRIRLEWAF